MKVLYFLTNYPSYSETFIAEEINQLRALGHTPIICNFTFQTDAQRDSDFKIRNNSKNVFTLFKAIYENTLDGRSLFFNVSFLRAIISSILQKPKYFLKYVFMLLSSDYMLQQAKKENAEMAVNHFLFKSTLAGSFICEKLSLPYHLRLHTKNYFYDDEQLARVLFNAQRVTAIAMDVKSFYEAKLGTLVIDVVRQSVDISFLTGLNSAPKNSSICKIICIGRLVKKKGFNYLIGALGEIKKNNVTNWKLDIYGDGAEYSYLDSLIVTHGLSENVKLWGQKKHAELMILLAQADLLVVPSVEMKNDIDGIPTVLIEAMLMRIPVLAYNTAGIPEIVVSDKTGFLVEAKNIKELSDKLIYLIENPTIRQSVVEQAYSHVLKEYKRNLANEFLL